MSTFRGTSGRSGTRATPCRGTGPKRPHLAEEIYNLEDALVVAQWLNVFLRKSHVLKIACVAQIVNVISWLQTRTRWPAQAALLLCLQAGQQLCPRQRAGCARQGAPMVETRQYGAVPALDVSASHDPETGQGAVFIVNRSQTEPSSPTSSGRTAAAAQSTEAWQIGGHDPKEANSWEEPNRLVAAAHCGARTWRMARRPCVSCRPLLHG